MKDLDKGEFNIIKPSKQGGGPKPPQPPTLPPDNITPWKPKPGDPPPPPPPGGKGGDGKGEGKDKKPGQGTGGEITSVTIVPTAGTGGIISTDQSAQLQKDLGVPVELPTMTEEQIRSKIREALREGDVPADVNTGSKSAGAGSGGLRAALAKLTRPQVDWRQALRKFIGRSTQEFEEIMGHRNFIHSDDYIWTERDKENTMITEAVCAVDVSGSMSDDNVAIILNEIKHMVEAKNVKNTTIVYFHSEIEKITELKGKGAVRKYDGEKVGSGGTNFVPPLSHMQAVDKKGALEVALFLTDGYDITWDGTTVKLPKPKYVNKFIWVILDNPAFQPPWGHMTVYIETNRKGTV
jgi:hypothetical protein